MRRNFLAKVSALLSMPLAIAGFTLLSGQPAAAQTFPGLQFGCSAPSGNLREYPYGLGNAYNNALITTPTATTATFPAAPMPLQSDVAVFGGYGLANGGFFTGQERCSQVAMRLNAFNGAYGTNAPSAGTFVFGVTYSAGANPIVCLQPIGTTGCPNLTGVPIGGTISPGFSYTIVPIVNAYNKGAVADQLIGNLGATAGYFRTAPNSMPAMD